MILITGGAGYIGSHCVLNFIKNNIEDIVVFDNLETGHIETINTLKDISPRIIFEKGDLRNKKDVEILFSKYSFDAVIHFAAFSLVGESVENPSKYYNNNLIGAINLLDEMVKNNVLKIVFSSTAAVYGEPKYTPIDENHPLEPVNPYGKSKLMIERMLEDYDKAYGLKSVCLRYFNVIGADKLARIGEWHNIETHLVPNVLKGALDSNFKFKIFGDDYETPDGTCIRDYIDVEDLAIAHQLACEYLKTNNKSQKINLGTQKGSSVKEILTEIEKVLNLKINVEIAPKREGDPKVLLANANKAKEILGWIPSETLEKSINTAYNWQKKLS